ncbi:MAG: zinc ribbon domain-containing protein [Coriobacteriales bacterium]|jgi:uncharacterized OB-fold protein|nr:zinc ribbon domain-containing protein [Coriobacteriales bacterium]
MFKPQPVTKRFYDGLDEGRFVALKCTSCGHVHFPPLPTCGECGSFDLEWTEVSGSVTVTDAIDLNPALANSDFKPYAPYHIGEATLEEGPEINTIVLGLKEKDYEKIRSMMPMPGKLMTIQHDGFKTVAVQLDQTGEQ